MPNYAIIENGVVVNVAVAEQPLADGWVQSETAAIGDRYENGQFVKPAPVVKVFDYRAQRAAAYPPIGDQLDALWKGGDAAAEMLAQVQAVKAAYPKPE